MSDSFHDSEEVGKALEEIVDLQYAVLVFAEYGDEMPLSAQRENLKTLRLLLEKQRNMFFRCQLEKSESESAKELHDDILMHLQQNGHIIDWHDPIKVFDQLELQVDDLELDIRNQEEREMWHATNCHMGLASHLLSSIIKKFSHHIQRNPK